MSLVGNGTVLAVGIDVFDGPYVVVYCLMVSACAVADRAVDTAECDSGGC